MCILNKEIIEKRICNTLTKCVAISRTILEPANWTKPLTGELFKLSAVDLVYFLFELENEFEIRFPPEAFDDYRFGTLAGISKIVSSYLL